MTPTELVELRADAEWLLDKCRHRSDPFSMKGYALAPVRYSVAFPPLPASLPSVAGFWSADGGETPWDQREQWLTANVPGERRQRLLAVSLAGRCLPVFERDVPNDDRPRNAIETAEWFADLERPTKADSKRLAAARKHTWYARSAAGSAAVAAWAAGSAAWAAAWAAGDAAWAAAGDAAGDAAGSAARAAECREQSRLLSLWVPLPDWHERYVSDEARAIARTMYDIHAWHDAPYLADAIEDREYSGWILDALRDETFANVAGRGIWIVDQLTGRM